MKMITLEILRNILIGLIRKMNVDFFSYNYVPVSIKNLWLDSVSKVLQSGELIGGSYVKEFEQEFAKCSQSKYAIGVSNGFDGLEIALRALGIGKGDSVAVPAHTFIATWNAVLAVGALPVGIDVGIDAQIDVNKFKEISSSRRISCVIPVHMHGHMSDMVAIARICRSSNIPIIEDASQSHFANRDGKIAGNTSAISVFSLYPTKNLGALGDAGVIVTNQEELAVKARKLANYGSHEKNKYWHTEIGYNKRLDAVQAAILTVNLKFIKEWNLNRRELSKIYAHFCEELQIPYLRGGEGSVWHHFCIQVSNRDRVQDFLLEQGIGTDIHYPFMAAHEVEQFAGLEKGNYPIAQTLSDSLLSLPISQFHDKEMINYVGETLKRARCQGVL
jgi:dTDP-4-amino-4,6-dideoxygalactose transaminase